MEFFKALLFWKDREFKTEPTEKDTEKWQPKSFNMKKLKKDLRKEDTISVFLRGHIYLEHVLLYFIGVALEKPNSIDLDRLSFLSKVELSVSLGLVSEDLKGWFAWVNRCRNKVAHNIDFEPASQDILDALNTLPKFYRDIILEKDYSEDTKSKKIKASELSLGRMLSIMVVVLDQFAQEYEKQQRAKKKAHEKLKTALDDLDEFNRNLKLASDKKKGAQTAN